MALGPVMRLLLRSNGGGGSTSDTERENWGSRMAFILASMGGAVGVGNLLRYPSIAARYSGLQWFLPYFLGLFFVGLPLLILEIALGQAHRGGAVVSYSSVHRRLRGVGLSTVYIAFVTATYYVVIMAWVLVYFRNSFVHPLPWFPPNGTALGSDATSIVEKFAFSFFFNNVTHNVDPIKDPAGVSFTVYPGVSIVGETLGWAVLTWFLVYLCIFRGVGLTGRIVYFTMLIPLFLLVALLVRSVTLENAGRGIRHYVGKWDNRKLADGKMWQEAVIQIFFSIGTGFGYFIAYASYNTLRANVVQDALIIALGNSFIEVVMGFAAFAVIGFLNVDLGKRLNTFVIGFITYPTALAQLPGANAWAAFFFITVYLLAIDSAFALVESFATVITDPEWSRRLHKPVVMAAIVLVAMLSSFMYCTQFGLDLLDAVDTWLTGIALMFSSWVQVVAVTGMYRYKDVISQTGALSFSVAQGTYIGSMVLGVILAWTVKPAAGGGIFAAVLVVGILLATVLSKPPEVAGAWGGNRYVNAFWWLTSYSGHQLKRDLNTVIARGRNWSIPFFWAPVLRWVTAPVLMIMLSISYSEFYKSAKNPLHVFAFVIAHLVIVYIVVGFLAPISFAWIVPKSQLSRHKKQYETSPGENLVHTDTGDLSAPPVTHDSVEDSTA